jgi:hypothetical protein
VSVKEADGDVWLSVLVSALEQQADAGDLMAELVLELGDLEGPVPRPAGMRRGRQGYCFANASRRACDDDAGRYLFVEGFAIDVLGYPFHHAWISEGRGAIEVTWPTPGRAYMGIRFGCREWAMLYRQYRRDGLLESLTVDVKGRLRAEPSLLPQRLANGRLLVPRRVEGPRGPVNKGVVEVGPDDPGYAAWLAELDERSVGGS